MKIKLTHLAVLAALLLLTFQILTNEWLLNFEHKESAGGIRQKSAIEKSNEGNSVYSQELNSGATTMSDNTHLADNSMMSSNGQFDGLNRVNQGPDLDRTNSNILQENCDRRTYEPKEDSPLKSGDTLLSLPFDAQKFLLALKDGEEIDRSYFKYGYWLVPYYIQFIRDNGVAPEGKKRIILILAELQADVAAPAIAELLHDERFESQVRHYFKRVVRLKFIPLLLGHLSYEAMRKNPHLASNATKIFAYYPSHEVARHLVGMIRQDIEAGKAKRALEQIFSWAPYVESAPLAGRTHEEWWRDIWEKHIATVESCDVDWWKIERIESTANAESDDAALGFPWPEGTEVLQKTCAGPFRMALKPDPVFTRLLTFYSQLLDPDGKITQHIDELEKRIIFDIANEFQGYRVFGLVPILLDNVGFLSHISDVNQGLPWSGRWEKTNPIRTNEGHFMDEQKQEKSTVEEKNLNGVLKIDEQRIEDHLGEMVRSTVEETLNAMLDVEADQLCGAKRYERSPERVDSRAGHYQRQLVTRAGEVTVKVPKLRKLKFETEIIERYRRREASVEEALIEMYLAGVSVRRIEDITEALWGTRVSASTVSELNQKIYGTIEEWRNRPITGEFPYVYLDGICLKRSWGGEVRNISILVAIGVNRDGYREILGVAEGAKEDKEGWLGFLRHLKDRGLRGVQLIISDACRGLVESLGEVFPAASWQRCTVHFYRNVFSVVPKAKMGEVAAMLKAIHAQEDGEAAGKKADDVIAKLKAMKLSKAAEIVAKGIHETLTYYLFPREHWRRIRTNNPLERIMREIRRRTRVVGNFPDGQSALMLTAARLRHIAGTQWGTRRYLDMDALFNRDFSSLEKRATDSREAHLTA